MSRHLPAMTFGTALALCCGMASAEPLATINSEQSGAAAWLSTQFAMNYVDVSTGSLMSDPVSYTVAMLTRLAKVTTPATLRAQPGGITVPCKNGGSFTVRMSSGVPRVLTSEWNGCALYSPAFQVASGPLQVLLPRDSFAPGHVLAIAMGTPTRNFVLESKQVSSDEVDDNVESRNVRMTGWIPVDWSYRPEGADRTAYEISGFQQRLGDTVFADPNRPPEHVDIRTELENGVVWVVNAWGNEAMYTDDDWHYVTGAWTQTYVSSRTGSFVTRWSVDNLRIHRITDFANWNGSFEYDGGFSWTWPVQPTPGSGCLNGRFAVRTKSPFMIQSLDDSGLTDSGELSINNGAATFRTYSAATLPHGLPPTTQTLLSMTVRGVGTFNYDEGLFPNPVNVAANCR